MYRIKTVAASENFPKTHEHIVMRMGYTHMHVILKPPAPMYTRQRSGYVIICHPAIHDRENGKKSSNTRAQRISVSMKLVHKLHEATNFYIKLGLASILHTAPNEQINESVRAYCIIFIRIRFKGFIMMIILSATYATQPPHSNARLFPSAIYVDLLAACKYSLLNNGLLYLRIYIYCWRFLRAGERE